MTVPLVRSRDDRIFAGVCAGMAVYFDMDVTLMRVLWVIGTVLLAGVGGIIAYVILIFVIPEGVPRSRHAEDEHWTAVTEEE